MKTREKEKAILLRHEGKSVREICKEVGVAKGSVSVWVRDVVLTKEQKEKLNEKNPSFYSNLSKSRHEACIKRRVEFQEEGRKMAREMGIQYAIGCMLYWGEGTKSNQLDFTNSDLNILKVFVSFIKKYWGVKNSEISLGLNCYLDHELSVEDIFNYWIKNLDIQGCRIQKAVVRNSENSSFNSGRKKSKLKYGVLKLRIGNTRIFHNILGSIQEYGGFIEEKWLGK